MFYSTEAAIPCDKKKKFFTRAHQISMICEKKIFKKLKRGIKVKYRCVIITSTIDESVLKVTSFSRTFTTLDKFNNGL